MTVKLPTEHHLEFPSLKGSCTGSSESTFVKMPYCWKSYVTAHMSPSMEFGTYCIGEGEQRRPKRDCVWK